MGVIKRGILGGFSGKVANVIGSSWKGIAYMKSMPLSVANPQTAGQTTQRNAFAATVAFAGLALANWIKPLWDRFAQGMSGYNDFVSKNIEFFPDGVITGYGDLKMSIGTLQLNPINAVTSDESDAETVITWTSANGTNGANTDLVYAAYYNSTQGYMAFSAGVVTRNAGTVTIADARLAAGDSIWAWLAFRKADGTLVSNSSDGNTVVVA